MKLIWLVHCFLFLLGWANGAFLVARSCNAPTADVKLQTFVVDAALDPQDQILKFFINSEVVKRHSYGHHWNSSIAHKNITTPLVTDVNTTTNRYTTFHASVLINDDMLVDEYLRFCDMVVVKNISNFDQVLQQHRNESASSSSSASSRTSRGSSTKTSSRPLSLATGLSGSNSTNSTSFIGNSSSSQRLHSRSSAYALNRKRDSLPNTNITNLDNLDYSLNFATHNSTVEALFAPDNGLRRCPLYNEDSVMFYYEVKIPQKYHRSLGSFKATFSVISNNEESSILGCYTVIVTPVRYRKMQEVVAIVTLTVFIAAAVLNVFTIMFSSSQESSNPFLHVASSICNAELLSQMDANASMIVQYFQFAYFVGSLGLDYPGFYQPLVLQFRWVCLIWIPIIGYDIFDDKYVRQDDVYLSFDAGGFNILKYYSSILAFRYLWANFIIALICLCLAIVVFEQLVLFLVKRIKKLDARFKGKLSKKSSYRFLSMKNLYFILGQILNVLYNAFAFPFLVITSYIIYSAANFTGKAYARNNLNANQQDAFNPSVPYAALRIPWQCYETPNHVGRNKTYTSLHFDPANPNSFPTKVNFNTTTPFARNNIDLVSVFPKSNVVLACLFFAIWILVLMYGIISVRFKIKRWSITFLKSASKLYTSMKTILLWGFAYYNLKPSKVYFVGVNLVRLMSELFIIGYLQDFGLAQVNCLIIIEVIYFLLIFLCKPYYLPMTWFTMRLWIPFFRIVTMFLCLPYVSVLAASESSKANAAYAQLLVHTFVAVYFICRLTYCLWITCKPFVKRRREARLKASKSTKPVVEDYINEFEYHPVVKSNSLNRGNLHQDASADYNVEQLTKSSMIEMQQMTVVEDADSMDGYYRHNSENYLRKIMPTNTTDTETKSSVEESIGSIHVDDGTDSISSGSFEHDQHESKLRLQTNNYAYREGDHIYKQYINDEDVDEEIKELWDMRMSKLSEREIQTARRVLRAHSSSNANSNSNSNKSSSSSLPKGSSKVPGLFNWRKRKPVASFEVSRPRQLVVRTLEDVDCGKRKPEPKPDENQKPDAE